MTWLRDFAVIFDDLGNVSAAADRVGRSRRTVYYHLERDADLRRQIEDARERRPEPKIRIRRN